VEIGDSRDVFARPRHPYTRELLRSTISLSTQGLTYIPGAPPDLVEPPSGCRFHPRCPDAMQGCITRQPPVSVQPGVSAAACWLHEVDRFDAQERMPAEREEIADADEA
jgi:peptide/nickel transport system ATP-binding protein